MLHTHKTRASYMHKDMLTPTKSYTHIQSRCAMTQRGAAGVKAPVAVVSCHHLEEYMSPCLLSQQHKSPPNNWVSEDQHVSLCHLFVFFYSCVCTVSTDATPQNTTLSLAIPYCSHSHGPFVVSCQSGQSSARIRGALIKLWRAVSSNNPHRLSEGWQKHLCCGRHRDTRDWGDGRNIWRRSVSVLALSHSFHSDWVDVSVHVLCVWTYRRWRRWVCKKGLEGYLFFTDESDILLSQRPFINHQVCVQQEHKMKA